MARIARDEQLVPSILDRLIDEEPDRAREAPPSDYQVIRQLRQSVRRDVENILNTRQGSLSCPPEMRELARSLVTYGIPDFCGASMDATRAGEMISQTIRRAISEFEPRLRKVQVELLTNSEPMDRTMRFRISAMLQVKPAPEPIMLDSSLEPATANFEVKAQRE